MMRVNISLVVCRVAASALLCAGALGVAQAQMSPAQALLDNKFVGSVGGFVVSTDTRARLNGSSSTNPDIDFDETFGNGGDSTRIRADALWRFTPRHHLRFLYFDNTTSRSRNIDRNVQWGDLTFQAGALVEAETKFRIFELAYEYAFMKQPNFELAGSLGVHYMDLKTRLSGTATITDANGNVSNPVSATKESSVPLPLPVIGLRAGWAVAPQWYLEGQGQFFKAEVGDYDGHVIDLRATATWMFSPNFGVGVGYNRFITKVDVDRTSFNGSARLTYSGIQLFVTGTF
jgi:hypothetical protein